MIHSSFFLEFEVKDEGRFRSLHRVFEALKEDKQKQLQVQNEEGNIQAFRDDSHWVTANIAV